ncbi:MAG: acyltransferase [Armatimonadetes bacterium]|nr:acyltransferase [Armatimonadota bacterium]
MSVRTVGQYKMSFTQAQGQPTTARHESAKSRLEFLDGLRALAALYVLLHHVRNATFTDRAYSGTGKGLLNIITFPLTYGHLAVALFIVLSGYCLMLPVLSREHFEPKTFLLRRAQRILPPYYAALILTFGITLLSNALSVSLKDAISWQGILARIFLCQEIPRAILWEWNLPLWSVAVEWKIYLVFPLVVAGIRRFGAEKTVAATLLCSLVLLYGLALLTPLAPSLTLSLMEPVGVMPQLLGLFGFGVLAAVWSRSVGRLSQKQLRLGALIGMGLGVGLEALWQNTSKELPRFVTDYLFGAGAACLLAYLAQAPKSRLRALVEWRSLVALGGMSYSVYLLHDPIVRLLSRGLLLRLPISHVPYFVLLSALSLMVTLALSWLFFRLVEQPTLRKIATTRS